MDSTEKITSFIKDQYGDNLVSFYEYGCQDGLTSSPTYFLIVVKSGEIGSLRLHALRRKPFKETAQFSVFTEKELSNAIDVFPIEFLEMKHTRQLLIGKDLLNNIDINLTHLRHECEYTLRSNILKLRSALLLPKVNFSQLIAESFPVFFSSLKCVFTLQNKTYSQDRLQCLKELAVLTSVSLDSFINVIEKDKISETDFQLYMDVLAELTSYVNAF